MRAANPRTLGNATRNTTWGLPKRCAGNGVVQPRIVVPGTAIMRLRDKDWIFRKEGDQFRRLEVHVLGGTPDGMQEIQSAAHPGDEVVANALEFSTAVAEQGK